MVLRKRGMAGIKIAIDLSAQRARSGRAKKTSAARKGDGRADEGLGARKNGQC